MQFWYSVKTALSESDVLCEVLDARMPELSRSKDIEDIAARSKKPLLFVVNKSDLIPRSQQEKIKESLGENCLFVSGRMNLGMKALKETLFILGKRIEEPRICFVGYPNVGKSSVINALAKRAKARVSPVAGTTKGLQWIRAGGLRILDSPGVIPVDIHDEERISLLGARDPQRLKYPERSAAFVLRFLIETYPGALERQFGLTTTDAGDFIEQLAVKRRFLKQKGELDIRKAASYIIREWQQGRINLIF